MHESHLAQKESYLQGFRPEAQNISESLAEVDIRHSNETKSSQLQVNEFVVFSLTVPVRS